jgi:hypothetical protein
MLKSRFATLFALLLVLITSGVPSETQAAAPGTVVVGTGDPDVDVPAVQAAVDQGGEIILKGRFSFDRPPTRPTALGEMATVLVANAVTISGTGEDDEEMASIEGGRIPFYVEAPGASVTIRNLRFRRPEENGIEVFAVNGLAITSCEFEGTIPVPNTPATGGISILTVILPTLAQPGHPENVGGRLLIANNTIDATGGTASDSKLGIVIYSVGQSSNEADVYVIGNHIRNVTEPAIALRRIGGRAHVEGNVITTGPVSSPSAPRPEAIRVANTGSYVIAHNAIECQWPDPEAMGIGLFSQISQWPLENAEVLDNDVTMLPLDGTVFGTLSAGIDIRGFAQANVVSNNRIRGQARAAVALDVFKGGTPGNNVLTLNRFDDFEASRADVFVDVGVADTLLLGQKGTVEDLGVHTVVIPFFHGAHFRK